MTYKNKFPSIDEERFNLTIKKLRFITKILPEHITDREDADVLQELLLTTIREMESSRIDVPIYEMRPRAVNQN